MIKKDFFKIESPKTKILVSKYRFPKNGIGFNEKLNCLATKFYWI